MPVYTIQLKDGRKVKVEAGSPEAAFKTAATVPPLTGEKADYQRALTSARKGYEGLRKRDEGGATRGVFPAIGGAMPIVPVVDELVGGVRAWENTLDNIPRRLKGQPTVSSRAVYEANRDAVNEYQAETRRRHPGASLGGSLLGGLVVGGAGAGASAPSRLKAIGTAMGVGGASGAVGGAFEGRTPQERMTNALIGGGVGLATGGLLEGAAPYAVKAAKAGKGLIDDVVRAVNPASAKKTTAADAAKGTRAAIEILQRKGLTSANVPKKAAPYADIGITAAELAGPDVVRRAGANARRSGSSGDEITKLVRARAEAKPDRLLQGMRKDLGVNPRAARGDAEEYVKLGRALADPEYAAMRAQPGGLHTPDLERLMQHPLVRKAIAQEERLGRLSDDRGVGLAWADVDVPSRPVGPDDLSFAATGAPESMPVPRGPGQAPSQGPSALTALRQTGEGMGLNLDQQGLRLGQRQGGAELHDMAIRLHEMGYTPRVLDETEMAAMLENGGARRTFAREADAGAQQRFEARRAAEEFNARGGDPDALPHPDDYGNAGPAPERPLTEPARMMGLTQDAWDKVLRRLDKGVKRDSLTGKVIRAGDEGFENEEYDAVARGLRQALFGGETPLAPELKTAREVAGDYMGLNSAFERGRGMLRGPSHDLNTAYGSLANDAQRDMFKAAGAADLYDMWEKNLLSEGAVKRPGMRQNLETVFGGDEATALQQRLAREAELAASGSRMAPAGGSGTAGWQEGMAENDQALSAMDWGSIIGQAVSGHPLQALGQLGRKGEAYARTAGTSEAYRDALGAVLRAGPEELTALLQQAEQLPPPVRNLVMRRAATLGLISGGVGSTAVGGDRPDR